MRAREISWNLNREFTKSPKNSGKIFQFANARKTQKGAREFLPLRLALYHILPTKSIINFTVYPFHSIIHIPRLAHTCTIGAMNPESCARVCDRVASVFTLSNGFPVHCIVSFTPKAAACHFYSTSLCVRQI